MRALENEIGVLKVTGDQCQYGQQDREGNPMKKPTTFMTNSVHIGQALDGRCTGRGGACSRPAGGNHVVCSGRRAR